MRMLHTADWHLGRTFHGADLLGDQDTVLRHLAEVVADERIDVVAVAGDIYDRAVPSAETVGVATRALARLRDAGAQLVLSSGNHDSGPRLGAFAEFAAAGGLHLRTAIDTIADPVVLDDEHGQVAVYGIPYLEPDACRAALGVTERGHTPVLREAMRRIRADSCDRGLRSIVLAHAFVTGGADCDSERAIAVGGVADVPTSVFDGPDYVALGHLHGAQTLTDRVRYAGSPLAYSFSESRHRKSVWIVDIDADGLHDVRRHELPVPRPLATVTGTIDELLTDPAQAAVADCYLSVTLTDDVRPIDAMRRLRERFPHAVHVDWEPAGGDPAAQLHYTAATRGRSDVEIAERFVTDCRGSGPSDSETELISEALTAAATEPVG